MTTVYEIVKNAAGAPVYASPFMQFQYGLNGSITTPCLMQMTATANNSYKPSALITVPCVNGVQTWTGYNFVGLITDHSKTTKFAVANKWQVPVNVRRGCWFLLSRSLLRHANRPAVPHRQHGARAGVARLRRIECVPLRSRGNESISFSSLDSRLTHAFAVPPMVGGGNLDNRRIGVGATMYYKVQVNGGLLSMGDAHTAQGDSELDGTGMETSINADLQITLIKSARRAPDHSPSLFFFFFLLHCSRFRSADGSPNPSGTLPAGALSNLNFPLLENDNEFNVHGFTCVAAPSPRRGVVVFSSRFIFLTAARLYTAT